MKKSIKISIGVFLVVFLCLSLAFVNKPNDINESKTKLRVVNCSATCLFSKCSAGCSGNTTAICTCRFGFARCQCGTTVGGNTGETDKTTETSVEPEQIAMGEKFVNLLISFNSNSGNKAATHFKVTQDKASKNNPQAFVQQLFKFEDALLNLSPIEKDAVNKFLDANGEAHGNRL